VELRTSEHTEEVSALQKAHDFIRAFLMGFEVQVRISCVCVRERERESARARAMKTKLSFFGI
jgi:hypothetical protein